MAARKKPLHPNRIQEMREKIRATLLVNKLEDHVLNEATLTDSQVRAALGLLAKVIPNVSETKAEVEHTGAIGFQWLTE